MAKVTVCIPTYRRTRWLGAAIESVLAQTYGDFVLEVHDDATPGPAVRELVARYDDARLRLVAHAANAGIVGNFTRSLIGARTEYVLQLGDDDEAHPELLAATVAALDAHPSAGLAHAAFDLIDAQGDVISADADWLRTPRREFESGADFLRASMAYGSRVCSSTALLRRAAVPPDGFRPEDFPPFDFGCWLRLSQRWDVAFVARPLCRYRIHGESHSSGVSELTRTGYLQTRETLRAVHAVKRRHVADPELRARADRALRRDLVARARERTLPERRLGPTVRELTAALRDEPALAREPGVWTLLAGSLLGPGGVRALRRARPSAERRA